MISELVGFTGFVGSNLSSQHQFNSLYNSKNIIYSFGTKPELLVYAGLRAEKFIANKFPEQDLKSVKDAFSNIKKIQPETVVLISSIDIYNNPVNVDEDTNVNTDNLSAYGLHRYMLERWVEETFDNHLIIRLPALFGINLKKNFLYDYINIIPSQIDEIKFTELRSKDKLIEKYYHGDETGYYKCQYLSPDDRKLLKEYFQSSGFSALNFTDSRAVFQFYNLSHLWDYIKVALENNIKRLNIATEPIKVSDLFSALNGGEFVNELNKPIPYYNFKSKYAELFGGKNGYMQSADYVMNEIKQFVLENKV